MRRQRPVPNRAAIALRASRVSGIVVAHPNDEYNIARSARGLGFVPAPPILTYSGLHARAAAGSAFPIRGCAGLILG
jgi:hypothetical protein